MCYCPTPTLHLNLALTGDGAFIFSLKKTHSVWFISVLNYGDTENVLINHLLLVIPMSYPCHYTNLCPHEPHKHAHTRTHTRAHTHTHRPAVWENMSRHADIHTHRVQIKSRVSANARRSHPGIYSSPSALVWLSLRSVYLCSVSVSSPRTIVSLPSRRWDESISKETGKDTCVSVCLYLGGDCQCLDRAVTNIRNINERRSPRHYRTLWL